MDGARRVEKKTASSHESMEFTQGGSEESSIASTQQQSPNGERCRARKGSGGLLELRGLWGTLGFGFLRAFVASCEPAAPSRSAFRAFAVGFHQEHLGET